MTRILHLALLLLPTVLSQFDLNRCSKEEFVCIIQDRCKGEGDGSRMVYTEKGYDSYRPLATDCDVHVMIRQYTKSSYLIRIINKKSKDIKLEQDQKYFGCKLINGKLNLTNSGTDINMKLISPEKYIGVGMECEFTVTYTNGDEVFTDGKGMLIERNNEKQVTIEGHLISQITTKFKYSLYKCNPNSIQMDHDGLKDHEYSIQPIDADFKTGKCAAPYILAFVDLEGKVQEGNKIDCEQEVKDCDKADPQTCEWKYRINTKGKVLAQEEWKAVCRQKICQMCEDPKQLCKGPNCKNPEFKTRDGCNTLKCTTLFEEKSIVSVDGGNTTFGTFECVLDEKNENKAIWKFNDKTFKTATCFDTIECDDNKPLTTKCADKEKKEGCPAEDLKDHLVKCPPGFHLELIVDGKTIEPSEVQCDRQKGYYFYTENGEARPLDTEKKEDRIVACARQDSVKAATGFHIWQLLLIILGVLILIVLLILCIFCVRRSKKKEDERKALLKRNSESGAPSSTESSKPQTKNNLVHMQPCSTAKQISSEQISEATAIERTKKEYTEKTMIEPTLDLATAYSHDKSRQSKRETGSPEAEVIDDGKRSRSQRSEKSQPERDESGREGVHSAISKGDDDE
ncbi:hypothetical protein PRIPAC_91075 [Pristionchus pacificus]|uniref:Uncharacterized protein n=1 Tax=Pristionchus pacificus TaxID=54126 RepID=A0A2A6B8U1_PRIPA|nr:hypothetical protein PRIPAC_91075 [Pristionchus pacificus]|eukprot:PDM62300.1 hypothetical protein PRIPAC_51742 [Pristionchus pacificus]